jgi:hypothetical protein
MSRTTLRELPIAAAQRETCHPSNRRIKGLLLT